MAKLLEWKQNPKRKPLILKGARQVGKTFLLKSFGEKEFPQVHYFNFEKNPALETIFQIDLNPKRIIDELVFSQNKKIDIEHDLIIFDEIQACPRALTSLKYFCEDLPAAYLCCAGSLLGIHLGPNSYPVGKVNHMQLFPMTFVEFLMACEDELYVDLLNTITIKSEIPLTAHDYLWNKLKHYFVVGGLPEVVDTYRQNSQDLFTACHLVREKQKELIEDYYADIAKHSGKINAMHINRILNNVPEQLGRSQDGSAQKFKFKNSVPGIDRFNKLADAIDWLYAAGLILKTHIINNAHLPLKAYVVENAFKLFLFDVGILGALSDLNPKTLLDYDYGSFKGFFAENFVAQALQAHGHDALYSWTENMAEIEFLQQIENAAIPIEVKSGWVTQAKSLQVFNHKYHPPFRVIMSAKPLKIDTQNQLWNIPLYLAGLIPSNIELSL